MTRPNCCDGCLRWSSSLNRCEVVGWSQQIKRLVSRPCRWRRVAADDPGFFNDYVTKVQHIIQDFPAGTVNVAAIRKAQGADTSNRANNQFLGKALRHLVATGVLVRAGNMYKRVIA